jgi:hypothetical protein
MKKRDLAILACTTLLATGACGKATQEAPQRAPAATDGKTQAFLQSFASAIVERDYARAYGAVAVERRAQLSQKEFEETFRHYRDGLPSALKTEVKVEPHDKSSSLVPDELRDRIVAEGVVYFEPGGDTEGFNAIVWVMMESGEPKLASFYVED